MARVESTSRVDQAAGIEGERIGEADTERREGEEANERLSTKLE
jgi:hypothetical protein